MKYRHFSVEEREQIQQSLWEKRSVRFIARGGELQEGVNNVLLDLGGLRYKDEEVASNYGYLKEYRRVDVVPQTNILRVCFSGVGFADQELLVKIAGGKVKLP